MIRGGLALSAAPVQSHSQLSLRSTRQNISVNPDISETYEK
jgi:hypothetical protein